VLLLFGKQLFEVEGVEVRVIQEADDAPPGACDAVWISRRERRSELFNHHCGVRGAARRGSEAVRCSAEECLFAMGAKVAVCALSEGAEVVAEEDHDTLELFPVDISGAVVEKGAPEVFALVLAEVVDAGAGVGVDWSGVWGAGLDGEGAVKDMELGTQLAFGFGCGGSGPGRSGVFKERGAAKEGVDVLLRFE